MIDGADEECIRYVGMYYWAALFLIKNLSKICVA
jgi:hypothetical protein